MADFWGISFDQDYTLFIDELEDEAGIYLVYTDKVFLEVGSTRNLKDTIETHPNTHDWLQKVGKAEIFISFHKDSDEESRQDKEAYLKSKFKSISKLKIH